MSSVVKNTIDLLLEVNALRKERDALEADLRMLGRMGQNVCPVCANYNHGQGCKECVKCLKEDNFKWRGGSMNEFECVERLSREVCEGKRNMLQVERHLLKTGWNAEEVIYLMQRISDKISERKKGNGKAD